MKILHMDLGADSYDILLGHGLLDKAKEHLNLERRVFVVTDSGVPAQYAQRLAAQCKAPTIACVPEGEQSKCLSVYADLLGQMLAAGFTRADCVVAVGGGVVGDLAGFVASSYMRGVDFYNIPTTTLSQVDSSIGGKVAIDFNGVKNIVGAFYQPKRVLIDPDTLSTQNHRQLVNGLAEALKTGLIGDEVLFHIFEQENALEKLDEVIWRSLVVKKYVVEKDEKESGLRKTLNFGHTLGHGIESAVGLGELLHGECVGIGMLPMCQTPELRARVKATLEKYGLPTSASFDREAAYQAICHDKKGSGTTTTVVKVDLPGQARLEQVPTASLRQLL
ncbi:MAG: 3-dehydroquinate synthase [Pygmaiobacter massiliensis]|nr:3-dehydroquinate synthase [Pygmaiobacter massiliensis]